MVFHSEFEFHPLVESPPEGSVLGRIVSGTSSLEILINIAQILACTRALEEVRAELEAERKQRHAERVRTFLVLRKQTALRCRQDVCVGNFGFDDEIPNQGKLVPTQPLAPNCKHGLPNICCAICKEHDAGGLVDGRGTAKSYQVKKQRKKDPITRDVAYPSDRLARDQTTRVEYPHVASDSSQQLSHVLQRLFHAPQPRFTQVTPEDVAWGQRQSFRKITVNRKKVNEEWCKTCVETIVLATIAGVQITFNRHGMYVEQVHECGVKLVGGNKALPTLDYVEFVKKQTADLHTFQAYQRRRSRYSKESRYFQFVSEDCLDPKSDDQAKQFWLEMDHPCSVREKRHYVRHSAANSKLLGEHTHGNSNGWNTES